MLTRKLGRSGIEVSAVGMGCWAIGGPTWADDTPVGWGQVDDNESIRALQRAFALGVTFYDTADVYGTGHSERIVGKALADRRDQVVIATKFGIKYQEHSRQLVGSNADAAYIRWACEASLKRLNTDYIDLYQFHLNSYPAAEAAPVRDVLETLVQEGKIRAYGWSTDFVERAQVFAEGKHCTAIQFNTNVLDFNAGMTAFCEQENLAGILRGPLAMGLLTGKYSATSELALDDVRGPHSPSWMQYFKDGKPSAVWLQKLEAVRAILTSDGRTVAQGALAWLWGRSAHLIPIPGFKTVQQVEENAGALAFGALAGDQVAEIEQILER